jgi:glycerophosphoryl diester phosphodiesterase
MKQTLMISLLLCLAVGECAERRVLVHGHRGARAMRPENTLPAFQYAIEAGVDALELDMAVTRDQTIVVSHDPLLRPPVCVGPQPDAVIHQLSLAEIRQWDCGGTRNLAFPDQRLTPGTRMPALDEVLALASRGSFDFNIETKSFPEHPELTPPPDEFARLVLEAVRKRGLEKRVIVQSFDFRTLRAMKVLAPEIRRSALYEGAPRDFVAIAREAEAGIVSPEKSLVTPEQVRAAHKAGLLVIPWTADTAGEWDRLVAAGVDAIVTDDPAALLAYLRQRGLH